MPDAPESRFRTAWYAVQLGMIAYGAIVLIVEGIRQALGW